MTYPREKLRALSIAIYRSHVSGILLTLLTAWFAWMDLHRLLSTPWTIAGVAGIISAVVAIRWQVSRIRRSLPKDFFESLKNDPNFMIYYKTTLLGLVNILLVVALVVWDWVRLFHL